MCPILSVCAVAALRVEMVQFVSKFEPYVNALQIYSNALPITFAQKYKPRPNVEFSISAVCSNLVQYLPLVLRKL